jgi:hypothetical protein
MIRRLIFPRFRRLCWHVQEGSQHADSFRRDRSRQDDLSSRRFERDRQVLLRKKLTQKQLITFTANMQTSLIGMEACLGAHFPSRVLREQGHVLNVDSSPVCEAVLESNKNDFLDASAVAEAVDSRQRSRRSRASLPSAWLVSARIVCLDRNEAHVLQIYPTSARWLRHCSVS